MMENLCACAADEMLGVSPGSPGGMAPRRPSSGGRVAGALLVAAALILPAAPPVRAANAGKPLVAPDPPIRVLLADSATSLTICPTPAWRVVDESGKVLAGLPADTETTVVASGGVMRLEGPGATSGTVLGAGPVVFESEATSAALAIHRIPYGVGWWWASLQDRVYEGRIEMRTGEGDRLTVVNVLPLERYLRGVVPSEIGANSPHEALCAQAVAARSAAVLALTGRIYAGPHHDICSDVACQAYSGLVKVTEASDAAVSATRGLVLMFEGQPVSAYYASNCGGHTEDIRNVWPDRASDRAYWDAARFDGDATPTLDLTTEEGVRAWIESSPAAFCNPERADLPEWTRKNFRWTREVSAEDATTMAARLKKDLGRITAIRPLRRGPSGRLIEAEFVGEKESARVAPELAIRQVFEPPLRSAAFIVETRGDKERPDAFVMRGAGWGHGVGMCQTGAIGMSSAGRTHREILRHYYPNATLETLY